MKAVLFFVALLVLRLPAETPAITELEPGVMRMEVPTVVEHTRLRIYLPKPLPTAPVATVFLAPAGSKLMHGMALGDGDEREALAYVRAGKIVVAYELSGPLKDDSSDAEVATAVKAFIAAENGLKDLRGAIDYAKHLKAVDPTQLYVAGHSSAATVALIAAAKIQGLAGCIAFAPVVDVPDRLKNFLPVLEPNVPGATAFFTNHSPTSLTAQLKCPVFLFYSDDDTRIDVQQLKDGQPRALSWLKSQTGAKKL
jgi:dienelactone hydrolase